MTNQQSEQLKKLNEKWDLHNLVKTAIETAHTTPSPETKREIELLKANNLKVVEKLDNLEENLNQVKVQIAELPERLAEKFDQRYASKSTEVAVYSFIGLVVTGVVVAILALVLK